MPQFESIAISNNEGTVADKLRIFLGLLRKQARIWYSQMDRTVINTWEQLKEAFLKHFREIGYSTRVVLARLNSVRKKDKESLRRYTRKVRNLIGKLGGEYRVAMQIEWLPSKMDRYCRQGRMDSLCDATSSSL